MSGSAARKPTSTVGRLAVVVLDLELGQRRAAVEAPVHRLQAAVDEAALDDPLQHADLAGLVAEVHGPVRMVPVAEHADALEVGHLLRDLLGGVGAALRLHLVARQAAAEGLLDLVLDRQAVAVPARGVARVEAGELARLDDHVLQDLVGGVADVQLAVRVRRAVVQHEPRPAVARLAQPLVDALVAPRLDPARLALGQVAAHRERRVGQVQRLAVVDRRSGAGSVGAGASAMAMNLSGEGAGARRRVTSGSLAIGSRVRPIAAEALHPAMPGRRRCRVKFDRASSGGRWRRAAWPRRRARRAHRLGVAADRAGERLERVVARFVAQFVQAVPRGRVYRSPPRCRAPRANRSTCVSSSTRPLSSIVGRRPRLATPASGASPRPWTRTTKTPIAAGRGCGKRRFRVRKPSPRPAAALAERAAELGAVDDVAADAVGPAEQGLGLLHVAGGERGAHRRARRPAWPWTS